MTRLDPIEDEPGAMSAARAVLQFVLSKRFSYVDVAIIFVIQGVLLAVLGVAR